MKKSEKSVVNAKSSATTVAAPASASKKSGADEGIEPSAQKSAFESMRAEMDALAEGELITMNFECDSAAHVARTAADAVLAQRDELSKLLPNWNFERYDSVQRYAMGAAYANSIHLVAQTTLSLDDQQREIQKCCDDMLAIAKVLVRRKRVSQAEHDEIAGGTGLRDSIRDARVLARILRANPWVFANGELITLDEIARAEKLADEIEDVLVERDRLAQTTATTSQTGRDRQRAFTPLFNAWNDVRRTISFLRWNERDADTIAPSLYTRVTVTRRSKDAPAPEPAPVEPNALPVARHDEVNTDDDNDLPQNHPFADS
jgi:hypothetical protein